MTGGTTGRQTQALSESGKARVLARPKPEHVAKEGQGGGRDSILLSPDREAGVSLCGRNPPPCSWLGWILRGLFQIQKSRGLSKNGEKNRCTRKKKKKKVEPEGLGCLPWRSLWEEAASIGLRLLLRITFLKDSHHHLSQRLSRG